MTKVTITVTINETGEQKSASIWIIAVEEIECISDLDEGSNNQGDESTQDGFIYGKEYEFKIKKYRDDSLPSEDMKKEIIWEYSYKNKNDELIAKTIESSGETFKLKIDNLEMLGKEISICAYLGKQRRDGKLDIFCHNRFRYFDKSIFEKELNDRKDDPTLIEQHATSLCGTAAIIYHLAKDDKNLFYESYLDFFIKGEIKINSFELKPNPKLYKTKPSTDNKNYPSYTEYSDGTAIIPPMIMGQADWIILAGTRSSDNKSYEGEKGEDWDAINWVSYMEKAAKNLYGANNIKDETFYITGFDYNDVLNEIQSDYNNGWNIVMLIDSDMLDDESSIFGCLTNYHWIVYEGDLNIDNSKKEITFSYWCWHKINTNRTFKRNVFNTNFYGYIKYKK